MSVLATISALDWGWIEFVGLWLLTPAVVVSAFLLLIQHRRDRRSK